MAFVEINLCGNNHVFPSYPQASKSVSQIFLAGSVCIFVGCIKEIDTQVYSVSYYGSGLLRIKGPGLEVVERDAKGHAPHADL